MHRASSISISIVLALALASIAHAQPRVPDDVSAPLSDAARAIAYDVPDEDTPVPDEFYPVSNESHHELWYEHARDRGGAFVGVGSDQCYTLAAVQDARMMWLVDFDPRVPLVHRLYGVLVAASPTPDALIERFTPEAEDATVTLLEAALTSDPDRDAIVRLYRVQRRRMHPYLRRARRQSPRASWMADPALYDRVRALHRGGRVIARNGDVTADGALRAVGRAAARLSIPIRVVYFSNAEQFFPYGSDFVENLSALPADERSIVLRTFREEGAPYPEGERWHYMVQPIADMRARITENGYRHMRQMVLDLLSVPRRVGEDGVSVLDASIPRRYRR